MKRVYLDYAATTPVDPRVLEAMKPYFSKKFGNASTLYTLGQEAKQALDIARQRVANIINAKESEVVFTSGGTESNNFALKGIAFANRDKGKHIITTAVEHHAILEPCEWLKKQGFEITLLPVDNYGLVNLEDLESAIKPETILVSIMFANNEIGTIQPIEEIGKICREHEIYFHTDAVQAIGKVPMDVKKLNIDLLTISAHKIYGPKGVGALFIRNGVKIDPLIHGGGQEFGMRSGTEQVVNIVGLGAACELAQRELPKESKRLSKLRDYLIKNVLEIKNSHLNGHPTKRLPNNANLWFSYIEGESLITHLDMYGISASTGSACSSKSLEPSHVLLAIGLKHEEAHGSLRLTLGKYTTKADIDYTLKVLPKVINRLREISPFKGR